MIKAWQTKMKLIEFEKQCYGKLVLRLSYAVDHHDIPLCDGMIRIITVLVFDEDGCQEVFNQSHTADIVLKMLADKEIHAMDSFQLLLRNLCFNSAAWKTVTAAARQAGRGAHEKLTAMIEIRHPEQNLNQNCSTSP
jgi:hypothetical protein